MITDIYSYNQTGAYSKVQHKERGQNQDNHQEHDSKQDEKKVNKSVDSYQNSSVYSQKMSVSDIEVAKLIGLGVNLNIVA
jgi:hypothetical protein